MVAVRGMGLKFGVSLAALVCAMSVGATAAHAGAFALREQSAYYQGMSFAGEAVGNDLSSMFWNPAAAAAAAGLNVQGHLSTVMADSEMTATGGLLAPGHPLGALNGFSGESGGIGDPAVIPATYANYQFSNQLFFGLAVNSQYGLTTKPDDTDWAGSPLAVRSRIFSVNVNPTLAYKVTPTLTIGAGLQVQYFDVALYNDPLKTGVQQLPLLPGRHVQVDDIGFGATAGITWKPAEGTQIGLGYRSAIKHNLDGSCSGMSVTTRATGGFYCNAGGNPANGAGAVNADVVLPEMVSLGLRQQLSPALAAYGTVEWTNWSRITSPVTIVNESGGSNDLLSISYQDGWYVAGGLEYAYSPALTLRTGIGWEQSPTTDEHRSVMLPDNDRFWLSGGATYKFSDKMSMDFAYSHLFVKDAPITTGVYLTAEGETSIDIVSASFKYKIGGAEPELEPLK
jgi:long-chain fatty acid transport protein